MSVGIENVEIALIIAKNKENTCASIYNNDLRISTGYLFCGGKSRVTAAIIGFAFRACTLQKSGFFH